VERVVELLRVAAERDPPQAPDVYVIVSGERATAAGLRLIESLRDELPGRRFELGLGGGPFKGQFRRADRSGAPLALILGEDEIARGAAALKPLRREAGQTEHPFAELARRIEAALESPG
ncbi:MAG: His/Gly/Thr/Pro-type tRNA ligase C-terminal domain-containing protein, partial [Steroidobacteraceae bacterium]